MSTLARRYFVRAHAELGRGEYEAAAESFRAAMDMAPAFLSARLGYAAALVRLGDTPRAAQVLRSYLYCNLVSTRSTISADNPRYRVGSQSLRKASPLTWRVISGVSARISNSGRRCSMAFTHSA